jgi:hypothetical protein
MPRSPRPRMPPGVMIATGLLALSFAANMLALLYGGAVNPGALAIPAVFLFYLYRGHPLARQWAVFISGLGLVGVALEWFVSPSLAAGSGVAFALSAAVFLVLIVSLSLASSRDYFDLRCPRCRSRKVRAASFLYNRIKCRACQHAWNLREHGEDRARAFD